MTDANDKYCLNCGRLLADDVMYCHHCGQPSSTSRLSTRSFMVSVFAGLTRINRGVVYTCVNLLIRPWKVIADYVRGCRVRYTAPVQLLLILTFLILACSSLFNIGTEDTEVSKIAIFDASVAAGAAANALIDGFLNSTVLQYFFTFIPSIPILMLINRRKGEARYNFAEYLLAAIYMSDAVLAFSLVSLPLEAVWPDLASTITYLYILTIGCMAVYRSMAHLRISTTRRVLRVIFFIFASLVFYVLVILPPMLAIALLA